VHFIGRPVSKHMLGSKITYHLHSNKVSESPHSFRNVYNIRILSTRKYLLFELFTLHSVILSLDKIFCTLKGKQTDRKGAKYETDRKKCLETR
jgi:hypothetical protein